MLELFGFNTMGSFLVKLRESKNTTRLSGLKVFEVELCSKFDEISVPQQSKNVSKASMVEGNEKQMVRKANIGSHNLYGLMA